MQVLGFSGILLTLCVSSWGLVYNAEEFTSEGSPCTPLTPDPSLNMTWLRSVENWHMPIYSRSTLIVVMETSVSAEEFQKLTEPELKKSCFLISKIQDPPGKVGLYGLSRLLFEYQTTLPLFRDGVINWIKNGVYQASSYIVLSDNASYFLAIDELKDGVRGYWVATVADALSPTEWDKIYKRIESLNFPRSSVFILGSECDDDEYITQVKARKN